MSTLQIRTDRRGILMPPVHPFVSKHRSYKIAISTARRCATKVGIPLGVVTWHDDNFVVMPAWMARGYDEEELLVEFVQNEAAIGGP